MLEMKALAAVKIVVKILQSTTVARMPGYRALDSFGHF